MPPVCVQHDNKSLFTVEGFSAECTEHLAMPAECIQKLCEDAQDMIVHKVYQQTHTDSIKACHASSVRTA